MYFPKNFTDVSRALTLQNADKTAASEISSKNQNSCIG